MGVVDIESIIEQIHDVPLDSNMKSCESDNHNKYI